MSIVLARICPCKPGFTYASVNTYAAHFRSQRHTAWQKSRSEYDVRVELGKKEKEIAMLRKLIDELEEEVQRLLTAKSRTNKKRPPAPLLDLLA